MDDRARPELGRNGIRSLNFLFPESCTLCNFCSREHPLREIISSHFSEPAAGGGASTSPLVRGGDQRVKCEGGGVDGVKNQSGQWEGPGGGELDGCITKGTLWPCHSLHLGGGVLLLAALVEETSMMDLEI